MFNYKVVRKFSLREAGLYKCLEYSCSKTLSFCYVKYLKYNSKLLLSLEKQHQPKTLTSN